MKKGLIFCYSSFEEINISELVFKKVVKINFPTEDSFKIIPCFEEIKIKDIILIKNKIDSVCDVELRTDDYLGKMIVISYNLLELESDLVVVNTAGLGYNSIVFLKECLKKITKFLNKNAIIIVGNVSD